MARSFVTASADYLDNGSTPLITAYPFSMSIWYKPTSAQNSTAITITGTGITDGFCNISPRSDGSVRLTTAPDNISTITLPSSAASALSNGTWYRLTGVWVSSTDRRLYVNNTKFTDTSSAAMPTNLDRTMIGGLKYFASPTTAVSLIDGVLADAAIWSVALTDAEVATLAAGYTANVVRPGALVNYWPLHGHTSPEIDTFGKVELTVTGTTKTANPRLFTPTNHNSYTKNPRLAGNITESLAITDWRVTATRCDNGAFLATNRVTGSTYYVDVNFSGPVNITCAQQVDYKWSAGKVVALNDYCVPVNPDATPRLFKATDIGASPNKTHATTEPTWPSSGTVVDNDITWTYIADLVDPKSLGPKIPS